MSETIQAPAEPRTTAPYSHLLRVAGNMDFNEQMRWGVDHPSRPAPECWC